MLPRTFLAFCALASLGSGALAAAGDYLTSIPYAAADLLSNPSLNRLYLSAPSTNLNVIWVYDSETLTRIGGRPLSEKPGLMALSPDGSKVYYVTTVAGVDYINVAEAGNLWPLSSYASPHKITELVIGSGDRAYATYDYGIMHFDANGYVGDLNPGSSNVPTGIAVSADGQQLFTGVGPYDNKTLRQFDISGAAPTLARSTSVYLSTGFPMDSIKLALSPDSQTLAASFGGSFEIISTEEFWDTRERYPTYGSPPSKGLFSGDSQWFYVTAGNELSIFNAATGALDYSMYFGWGITSFALSGNGDRMFVGTNGEVRVFDTGHVNQAVPEPSSTVMAMMGVSALGGAWRRRRK